MRVRTYVYKSVVTMFPHSLNKLLVTMIATLFIYLLLIYIYIFVFIVNSYILKYNLEYYRFFSS